MNSAPDLLMSDNAKTQIGKKVAEILRNYHIADHQSEPHYQNQNPAERRIQDIKKTTNAIMDRTGTPAKFWLLCTLYVVTLFNHLAQQTVKNITPLQAAHGQQPDVSKFLSFHWWEPVYYRVEKPGFPSESRERAGRWAGPCTHKGDELTYWILDSETEQLLPRSDVRSAKRGQDANLRADSLIPNNGEDDGHNDDVEPQVEVETVRTLSDLLAEDHGLLESQEIKVPKFTPEELIGLTFLHERDNGDRVRAQVMKKIIDNDAQNHQNIKMLIEIDDVEELIAYNELSDIIEQQHEDDLDKEDFYTFKDILDHQGPLKSSHKDYKGSSFNVKVRWEDGSETWEPLAAIAKDDPVSCTKYAMEHDLLQTPGWKQFA